MNGARSADETEDKMTASDFTAAILANAADYAHRRILHEGFSKIQIALWSDIVRLGIEDEVEALLRA